ncbi:hypothetical protein ColTof3_13419 [Colletotrichum tofieldiae]|nr:hypothetical protein ColTof3_13419 [Colletotrichum tofieldiae]
MLARVVATLQILGLAVHAVKVAKGVGVVKGRGRPGRRRPVVRVPPAAVSAKVQAETRGRAVHVAKHVVVAAAGAVLLVVGVGPPDGCVVVGGDGDGGVVGLVEHAAGQGDGLGLGNLGQRRLAGPHAPGGALAGAVTRHDGVDIDLGTAARVLGAGAQAAGQRVVGRHDVAAGGVSAEAGGVVQLDDGGDGRDDAEGAGLGRGLLDGRVGGGDAGGEDGGAAGVGALQFPVQVADGVLDGAGHGQALGRLLEGGHVADVGAGAAVEVGDGVLEGEVGVGGGADDGFGDGPDDAGAGRGAVMMMVLLLLLLLQAVLDLGDEAAAGPQRRRGDLAGKGSWGGEDGGRRRGRRSRARDGGRRARIRGAGGGVGVGVGVAIPVAVVVGSFRRQGQGGDGQRLRLGRGGPRGGRADGAGGAGAGGCRGVRVGGGRGRCAIPFLIAIARRGGPCRCRLGSGTGAAPAPVPAPVPVHVVAQHVCVCVGSRCLFVVLVVLVVLPLIIGSASSDSGVDPARRWRGFRREIAGGPPAAASPFSSLRAFQSIARVSCATLLPRSWCLVVECDAAAAAEEMPATPSRAPETCSGQSAAAAAGDGADACGGRMAVVAGVAGEDASTNRVLDGVYPSAWPDCTAYDGPLPGVGTVAAGDVDCCCCCCLLQGLGLPVLSSPLLLLLLRSRSGNRSLSMDSGVKLVSAKDRKWAGLGVAVAEREGCDDDEATSFVSSSFAPRAALLCTAAGSAPVSASL